MWDIVKVMRGKCIALNAHIIKEESTQFSNSSLYVMRLGEGNGNALLYSCLENPMREEPGRLLSMGSQESDTT